MQAVHDYRGPFQIEATANNGAVVRRQPKSGLLSLTNTKGVTTHTIGKGPRAGDMAGGPGGDSPTYLCTVAYAHGWIDADTLAADALAGEACPLWLKNWYDSWAKDYADICYRNWLLRGITMPFVTLWAKSMAVGFRVGLRRTQN